jgi:hypothetical protein
MRRIFLTGVLLLLAGCQNVMGPRERRQIPGPVDDPRLSIGEQERKGRDRLALPETDPSVGPRTYFQTPWTKSSSGNNAY